VELILLFQVHSLLLLVAVVEALGILALNWEVMAVLVVVTDNKMVSLDNLAEHQGKVLLAVLALLAVVLAMMAVEAVEVKLPLVFHLPIMVLAVLAVRAKQIQ
tara:strand:- start:231 stop:539 length:309 start_codon:yes stop_codon:yes gene_type:complete